MANLPGNLLAAVFCAFVLLSFAGSVKASEIAMLRNGFTIRHDHHVVMGETTRLFLSSDDSSFTDVSTAEITGYEKDLSAPAVPAISTAASATAITHLNQLDLKPMDLNQVVNSASATYHLDPDLVNSVIHAESGFNARAVSPKGAQGLMQLMPSTAGELGVRDAFDPEANVGGGSRYLRELLERYDFDLIKALAAYNAGPQRVEQYNGVPPFHETRAYVARIVHEYNTKKTAQEKAERARSGSVAAKKGPRRSGRKTRSAKASVQTASGTSKPAASQVAVNSAAGSPR
jgi:soluble lytic murein transglycosylase-like protein